MWPVVVGIVAIAAVILGASKKRQERRVSEEAHRLREMQERRRRELGEEPVPGAGAPPSAETGSKTTAPR
jgi:FtsZ-interacting cell division protein ZipA